MLRLELFGNGGSCCPVAFEVLLAFGRLLELAVLLLLVGKLSELLTDLLEDDLCIPFFIGDELVSKLVTGELRFDDRLVADGSFELFFSEVDDLLIGVTSLDLDGSVSTLVG